MSCCSITRKQLITTRKECKFWKERYFVEKKCRNSVSNWVLGVFGFVVKVECDRQTNQIKIEGRENRDALAQAAISLPFSTEERVMLMEDKLTPEDFEVETSEFASLALATLSSLDEESISAAVDQQPPPNNNDSKFYQTAKKDPQQLETNSIFTAAGGSIELSAGQDSEEILYIGNYDENSINGNQPSYYIVRNSDDPNSEISFLQGDIENNSGDNSQQQQIFYRLSSPVESENLQTQNQSPQSMAVTNSIKPSPTMKKKTTPQPQSPKKRKSPTSSSQVTSPLDKVAKTSESKDKPKRNNPIQAKAKSKTPHSSITRDEGEASAILKPFEFGITLREKAEIYVRTKARAAIKKIGSGFVCCVCTNDYSYSSVDNAIAHTKIHFESTPYKCDFCELTFSIQKHLLHHRKQVHPNPRNKIATVELKPKSDVFSASTSSSNTISIITNTNSVAVPITLATSIPNIVDQNTTMLPSRAISAQFISVGGKTMLTLQHPPE